MLTLDSMLKTLRQQAAFDETGPHRFGTGYEKSGIPVPRDHDAQPKIEPTKPEAPDIDAE